MGQWGERLFYLMRHTVLVTDSCLVLAAVIALATVGNIIGIVAAIPGIAGLIGVKYHDSHSKRRSDIEHQRRV